MKIRTLASSSSGNSTVVYDENTIILVDAGIKLAELELKFLALDLDINKVSGIILTHEHSDHIKSVGAMSRKYNTPIYVNYKGIDSAQKKLGKIKKELLIPTYSEEFQIGDFVVSSFDLPHDAQACVGYNICQGNKKFSIATDLGHASNETIKRLYESDLVILESNHDEKMLINNPNYSAVLKARILNKNGHLSNKSAAKVVCDLSYNGVKHVVLGHLSEENNTPEIALSTIKEYLNAIERGDKIDISVAHPDLIGPLFHIK